MARLADLLAAAGSDATGPRDMRIDGVLMAGAATPDLIETLDLAGPFGAGASAPRFAIPSARVTFAKRAGEAHLRLTLDSDGTRLDAIAFNAFNSGLGPLLEHHDGRAFHVAGRLEIDTWGGRKKPKLRLEDAVRAG